MARKPRIYHPESTYHIMVRGNAGGDIFLSDEDRRFFYFLLEEGINRFEYRIHAFCLMTNHVHLAVQMGNVSLSKAMQNLCFRYARWINKRNKRVGHLFQGRHKAILVDTDSYFLNLIRYIHFNPVRANLVYRPEQYLWSSHRVYLGQEFLPWLTCNWALRQFSEKNKTAIIKYKSFMESDVREDMYAQFQIGNQKGHFILCEDDFLQKLESVTCKNCNTRLGLNELVKKVCVFYAVHESILRDSSRCHLHAKIRAVIGLLAEDLGICTLTAVSVYFNRDVSGLIRTMKRLEKNVQVLQDLEVIRGCIKESTSQA